MKIGILTFYRVANFGANLQALSTYRYLIKRGHVPIMLNYYDKKWYKDFELQVHKDIQAQEHLSFISFNMPNQSKICFDADDINKEIERLEISAIIVGSDAVMQHHPLLSRIRRGKRKPFYITHIGSDRMFPNPLWGVGICQSIKIALMSASSQNSRYKWFHNSTCKKMNTALSRFTYLGVRDRWTLRMFKEAIGINNVNLTPDPVFSFNQNVNDLVPTAEYIIQKFSLPSKYILISLHGQDINEEQLIDLKEKFKNNGYECVALPMPTGVKFRHPFDYEIPIPLSPINWYALLKYSSGYIGSNMHPIVVCLHNCTPCFSIDNWGTRNWLGNATNDGSSKVADILSIYGLKGYWQPINIHACTINVDDIIKKILYFPYEIVRNKTNLLLNDYVNMMNRILTSFE